MIDPAIAAALARVADRANDVLHAYAPGFQPQMRDVVRTSAVRVADQDALATASPEGTYYVVAAPRGEVWYTRDGALRFEGGALRTQDGKLVLGRPTGAHRGPLVPLRVDAIDAALSRARDPRIDGNGVVTCALVSIDPRTGSRREERVALGRIALARFVAGSEPVRVDDATVAAPRGTVPAVGMPGDGSFSRLAVHARDAGRVDIEAGLARLQEAYLSLETLQSAYRAGFDLEKGAMDLLK